MNFEGQHVVMRAIEKSDLPAFQRWANDPQLQRLLGGWHFPVNANDQEKWFAALSCQSENQRFAVELRSGVLIGSANLVSIDWKNRSAYEGLLLADPTHRRKGYGSDVLLALMRYAFDELGLIRLDTDIVEFNEASLKLHVDRCGWAVEGRKTFGYYREGRYWDKLILGITQHRYREIRNLGDDRP